ncbi:MAG: hypothetical protein AAF988_06785 [Pseudomonadota bacterium]
MNYTFDFDDRTASMQKQSGFKSVQAWKSKSTMTHTASAQTIENNFESALKETQDKSELRTAFAPTGNQVIRTDGKEPYTFADVVDVVNPLHHLPIVGTLYRGITGDEIKPASQIIGGGLFGGPIGVTSGTINAVAQIKTGKDIAGNILGFTGISDKKESGTEYYKDNPVARLNIAASDMKGNVTREDLPGTAISFINLSETDQNYTKADMAEGRTAGSNFIKQTAVNTYNPYSQNAAIPNIDLEKALPMRDPITNMTLASMPSRQEN